LIIPGAEGNCVTIPMGQLVDKDSQLILQQIKILLKDLKAKGLDDDTIQSVLADDDKASQVVFKKGFLILKDEDVKVRLTPMERTLYIFVASHRDGVDGDQFWRYWDELKAIYARQTVYDDLELVADAVDALCEDDKATLQTNVSRIKRKITDKVGKWAAEKYIIKRGKDGVYRVSSVIA